MEESLKITEGDKQKVTSIVQFLETMNDFEALCLLYTWVGVPLLSSKLSLRDCQPLLDEISSRLLAWETSYLSYAGRLQLTSLCYMVSSGD